MTFQKIYQPNLIKVLYIISIPIITYLLIPKYLGIAMLLISIYILLITKNLLIFVLSLYNILLGIAFDYYLRINTNGFISYHESINFTEIICLITFVTYIVISTCTPKANFKNSLSTLYIFARIPNFNKIFFYPSIIILVSTAIYITSTQQLLITNNFSASEIEREPFLEYTSILVLIAYKSAENNTVKKKIWLAGCLFLALVSFLASFRMAGLQISSAIFLTLYNGKSIKKSSILILIIPTYFSLMAISLLRNGISNFDIDMLLGYNNGILDNTFTAVIETSHIYLYLGQNLSFYELISQLLGAIIPLPSSLLPDFTSYSKYIYDSYQTKVPGGGLIGGYFIYFQLLLVPPFFLYIIYAIKSGNKSNIAGPLLFITFITIARWWLYNPNVLFKFAGFWFFARAINYLITKKSALNRQKTLYSPVKIQK